MNTSPPVERNRSKQFFKLLILDKLSSRVYNPSKFKVAINEENKYSYLPRNKQSHNVYDDGYVRIFHIRQMILLFQEKLG